MKPRAEIIRLAAALVRYVWRKGSALPDWAPKLSAAEKRVINWIERLLYVCMVLMPVSGYVFVMAGGYGVKFFGRWDLPNFIGEHKTIALVAEWTHIVTACLLAATLAAHWGVGIRHQLRHRDRYLQRMLPFTHQR